MTLLFIHTTWFIHWNHSHPLWALHSLRSWWPCLQATPLHQPKPHPPVSRICFSSSINTPFRLCSHHSLAGCQTVISPDSGLSQTLPLLVMDLRCHVIPGYLSWYPVMITSLALEPGSLRFLEMASQQRGLSESCFCYFMFSHCALVLRVLQFFGEKNNAGKKSEQTAIVNRWF